MRGFKKDKRQGFLRLAGLGALGLLGSGFGPFETVQAKTIPAAATCQLLTPRADRRTGPVLDRAKAR